MDTKPLTTFLTISANKRNEQVTVTLSQQNGRDIYSRTYSCTIDADDQIVIPNDLNARTQTMLRSVCLLMKYPNTYEGDSRPSK